MKKYQNILIFLVCGLFFGQEFKIITIKDSIPQNRNNYQNFEFINQKTSIENFKYLASVSCEGEKSSFSNIYEIIKFKSQLLGANSFKYIRKEESEKTIKIFVDVYYTDDKNLIENRKNEEENKIYIFGSDNLSERKKRIYKLNGKIRTIENRKFDLINYELGKIVKIANKDFLSQPVIIKSNNNFKSLFFNTDGWGRSESNEGVKDYGIFKIETYELFYQFDKNLGYTLLKINE